jgi:hypothetical protein
MKSQAFMTPLPLHDIYHDVLNLYDDDVADRIVFQSFSSTLKDARLRRYQRGSCTPEELCTYLESEDCLEEVKSLFQGSVQFVDENGRTHFAVILGSPNLLQIAGPENTYLFCDATFKTAPRPFAQLYNVLVSHEGCAIPILHACMSSKHAGLYKGVMLKIREICPNLEPRVVKSDFETALMSGVKSVFPGITQSGCRFHFAQAVFRAIMRPGKLSF